MKRIIRAVILLLVLCALAPAAVMYAIPENVASGVNVNRSDMAEIDYSNIAYGYVKIRMVGQAEEGSIRVLITAPNGVQYQYRLNVAGHWEAFPLSEGNGNYNIGVFERIDGQRFAPLNRMDVYVVLNDEFAPFLRPNQFVNFNRNSRVVSKAAELVNPGDSALYQIADIYNFVIENISYDHELAERVISGAVTAHVPDVDAVLARRIGICFDYAALMTAMLRSLGIPTMLTIGYVGDVHHAWINVHTAETGWINGIILFDGTRWRIMDPTFAAAGQDESIMNLIGTGENHRRLRVH